MMTDVLLNFDGAHDKLTDPLMFTKEKKTEKRTYISQKKKNCQFVIH